IRELGALLFLSLHDTGADDALVLHEGAQTTDELGVFRDQLRDNVARSIKCRLGVGHFLAQESFSELGRISRAIFQNCVGQRTEATLTGDLCSGTALWLVG